VSGNDDGKAKRGAALREFQEFLKAKDGKATYAGLRRVCSKEIGKEVFFPS
jgi:hypothetical protein